MNEGIRKKLLIEICLVVSQMQMSFSPPATSLGSFMNRIPFEYGRKRKKKTIPLENDTTPLLQTVRVSAQTLPLSIKLASNLDTKTCLVVKTQCSLFPVYGFGRDREICSICALLDHQQSNVFFFCISCSSVPLYFPVCLDLAKCAPLHNFVCSLAVDIINIETAKICILKNTITKYPRIMTRTNHKHS